MPILFFLGKGSFGTLISINLSPILKFVSCPPGVLALAYFRGPSISIPMLLGSLG